MLLNCGVVEDSWKSLGLQGDPTSQSWIFIRRTDAEAEAPILWPPDVKNWLIGKDPDVGKDWRQEEKGTTEDEMVGCHHQLNGCEFEQAPWVDWWWTGRPGVLQFMVSQRVGHDWATELNRDVVLYMYYRVAETVNVKNWPLSYDCKRSQERAGERTAVKGLLCFCCSWKKKEKASPVTSLLLKYPVSPLTHKPRHVLRFLTRRLVTNVPQTAVAPGT